ncbi:MAG: AMP-binding protein [Lachnospiraceae bacterium]|nr:AMP-binding protein [Lachnospiraceae bacterium]
MIKMKDFREFFYETSQRYKGLAAFRFKEKGKEIIISYEKFYKDLVNAANALFDICGQGNVMLMGKNSYDYVLVLASCLCGAGRLFLVDSNSSVETLKTFLEETKIDILLVDEKYVIKAEELRNKTHSLMTYKIEPLRNYHVNDSTFQFQDYSFGEMRIVFSTSGTTQGNKKRVMLSGQAILNNVLEAHRESLHEISGEPHLQLLILPLFHALASLSALLHATYAGDSTYISTDSYNVENELIEIQPHYVFVVPSIIDYLYRRFEEKRERGEIGELNEYYGKNLFCFLCGGAKINPDTIEKYSKIGIRVIRGYGMSEAGPIISLTNLHTESVDWDNMGNVICHEVNILEDEICIRGKNLMLGYYLAPELTEESYIDGWFHTGDRGYIGDNGLIYITGRLKNVIVLNSGEKVIPEELEEELMKISGIYECAVFTPNDRWINAYVYCRENNSYSGYIRNEVDKLNQKQPVYKRIREIVIGDMPLPRTSTNKVLRQEILKHIRVNEICEGIRKIILDNMYYKISINFTDDLMEKFEFDSLEICSFVNEIEEQFACKMDIDEYLKLHCIWDMGNYIYRLIT